MITNLILRCVVPLLSRGLFAFPFFLFFLGCSTPACRCWEFQEVIAKSVCFDGSRLLLAPDSEFSRLELEIVRSISGIRMYLNLFLLQVPCNMDDPLHASVTIQFEDDVPWNVSAYVLEGRQRVLMPGDVADILIEALLEERSFVIQVGRNQITVVPDHFLKAYTQFFKKVC